MNVVVRTSPWTPRDLEILFETEEVIQVDLQDLSQLVKQMGIYKSTSEARRAGRAGEIPMGFTEYKASKKKTIWIWNPSE